MLCATAVLLLWLLLLWSLLRWLLLLWLLLLWLLGYCSDAGNAVYS